MILVSAIINMKFKISSHAISCASILGMLLHLSLYYDGQYQFMLLVGVLLITGGVSSARLYLKAHDSFEILAGLSLGLLLGIISPFMIL